MNTMETMERTINVCESLAKEFDVSDNDVKKLIDAFCCDMRDKGQGSLQMLNTYMFFKDSAKDGKYLAIDFGGSNIRVNYSELVGGEVKVIKSELIKLRTDEHDYTTGDYTLGDIFDICAKKILDMELGDEEILLGHTFSFATKAVDKNTAHILYMAKGFETKDVVGQDVNAVLTASLIKHGLTNVKPVCVINDTTATLLYGRYLHPDADIACIVGTGHNTCYRNKDGEIINMESGGFNHWAIPLSYYEKELLRQIPAERKYLMEVLVGGKNLLNLANIVIEDSVRRGIINPIPNLTEKMLDQVYDTYLNDLDPDQNYFLKQLSSLLYKKKAILVACEIAAVLKVIDPELNQCHTVIFDGSVYKYSTYFKEHLRSVLCRMYRQKAALIETVLVEDASSKGAIVACAI